MKKLIILAIVLIFLTGCAGTFQPPEVCGSGQSVILKITDDNPTGLDKALLTINFAGLEKGAYTAEQAVELLDDIERIVIEGITYIDLMEFLDAEIEQVRKYTGAAVLIMGGQVSEIASTGGTTLIGPCDTALIQAHIEHQRGLVLLYQW